MKKVFPQLIFFVIIIVRILLFAFPSFHIDMGTWEAWSYRLTNLGFSNFYSKDFYTEYFPGYLYFLWLIGYIYHFVFPNLSFATFQFEVILKSITTLFDLGTSLLIYKIVKGIKPKVAYIASVLYLLNPAVIFNTSVWGQIDGIYTFFLVLSSYFLIEKSEPVRSVFFSSVAFIMKPQAIFFFPVLFSDLIKTGYTKKRFRVFFYSIVILIIFSLIQVFPFFPNNPVLGFLQVMQRSIDLYPYVSLFAFNFWSLFGFWKPDSQLFLLSYKTWGIVLYSISLILILFPLLFKEYKKKAIYLSFTLSFFASFLFLTRMHERYLFPVLAFFLISAVSDKRFIILYFLTSLISFLNLWYVYYYYNFVYNSFGANLNPMYVLIDRNHNILSMGLIIAFLTLLYFYYQINDKKA